MPESPATDAHYHLTRWLEFQEKYLLKRPLQPDDYIFPTLSAGHIHPERPISTACISKLINKMSAAANVKGAGHFTTHCFRRGGAQYRFMFAPRGERWSLHRVRWWGGWSKNESVSGT